MSNNQHQRARRHRRVRKLVQGTPQRPRLSVHRSNRNITAQIIDDVAGRTLAAASTVESDLRSYTSSSKITAAEQVGELIAQRASAVGVTRVVFDRGGNLYHGRVAAVADAARAGGLEF